WRRCVGAACRYGLFKGEVGQFQAALLNVQRMEWRFLDRRIGEPCDVAAGEDLLAVSVGGSDRNRHVVEDAASRALRGNITGDHLHLRRVLVTLRESLDVL